VSLTPTVKKKLKHTRTKDAKLLTRVATNPAYGAAHAIKLIRTSAPTLPPPSAVGAAFDLGAGPTALFAVLLAVAALLAVGGGLGRGRR